MDLPRGVGVAVHTPLKPEPQAETEPISSALAEQEQPEGLAGQVERRAQPDPHGSQTETSREFHRGAWAWGMGAEEVDTRISWVVLVALAAGWWSWKLAATSPREPSTPEGSPGELVASLRAVVEAEEAAAWSSSFTAEPARQARSP